MAKAKSLSKAILALGTWMLLSSMLIIANKNIYLRFPYPLFVTGMGQVKRNGLAICACIRAQFTQQLMVIMYKQMCIQTHTHSHTHTHTCAHAHTRTHLQNTHTHTHKHTHTHIHTHIHTHTSTRTHTYTHTRAHAHTRTHIHTHIHTRTGVFCFRRHCHVTIRHGPSTAHPSNVVLLMEAGPHCGELDSHHVLWERSV